MGNVFGSGGPVAGSLASGGLVFPPHSAVVGDLTFNYPQQYRRRYFVSSRHAVTGVHGAHARGVVVADYPLHANPEVGGTGESLRPDGVLFELYDLPATRARRHAPPVRFPVTLREFHRIRRRGRIELRELFFRPKGSRADYMAIAWLGRRAGKAEKFAVASFVTSLRVR